MQQGRCTASSFFRRQKRSAAICGRDTHAQELQQQRPLGDSNGALEPALQLAHTQNEGIISAINSGAQLRGILKRTQLANVEKLKDIQENFIKDYLTISNNGGIAVIDNASRVYTAGQ